VQFAPNAPTIDELRRPDGNVQGLLPHRINFGAAWSKRDYSFGWDGHYFHSQILAPAARPSQGRDRILPYWEFDACVQSELARWLPWKSSRFGLRGQVRVNNLFGANPPKYVQDGSGTGVQAYGDARGRVYSLSLTATF
jgi:outer membrane receptor protein involved in Fe transport